MQTLCSLTLLAIAMQQPPTQFGALQGTVVRAGTSEPIEGSQVMLLAGAAGAAGAAEPQPLQNTATDRSGRFFFSNVPPGRYGVRVQRDGYFGPSAAGSPSPAAIETAVVTANQPVPMRIELTPGAVITGQVRDAAGQPASNVSVQAYMLSYSGGVPSLRSFVSKMTDDRGVYRLFWVAPGDYYIGVTPRTPSAAAVAARIPQYMKTFYPGVTDLGATAPLIVKPGEEVSGIDVNLQSARPLRISGTVTSSVAPPPAPATAQGAFAVIARAQNNSAYLMLVNRDPAAPDAFDGPQGGTTVALNSSIGEFELRNVLPGFYDLYATVNDQNSIAVGRVPVDVRDQDVTGLAISVRSGVDVKGAILVAGDDGNKPLAPSVRVASQPEGSLAKVGGGYAAVQPEKDGTFTVPALPEGHYRFVVAGLPPNQFVADMQSNGKSVYDSGLDVGPDPPLPVQIIVKSGAAILEGTVVDGGKKPASGAVVALVPATRRENIALYYSTRSNPAGSFTFNGVAPGEYKLFAWAQAPAGAYYNAAFLSKYEARALAVTVAPDSKARVETVLIPLVENADR